MELFSHLTELTAGRGGRRDEVRLMIFFDDKLTSRIAPNLNVTLYGVSIASCVFNPSESGFDAATLPSVIVKVSFSSVRFMISCFH